MADGSGKIKDLYDEALNNQEDAINKAYASGSNMYGSMKSAGDKAYQGLDSQASIDKAMQDRVTASGDRAAGITTKAAPLTISLRSANNLRNAFGKNDRQRENFDRNVDLALGKLQTQNNEDRIRYSAQNASVRDAAQVSQSNFDDEYNLKKNEQDFNEAYTLFMNRKMGPKGFKNITGIAVKALPKIHHNIICTGSTPNKALLKNYSEYKVGEGDQTKYYYVDKKFEEAVANVGVSLTDESGKMKTEKQIATDAGFYTKNPIILEGTKEAEAAAKDPNYTYVSSKAGGKGLYINTAINNLLSNKKNIAIWNTDSSPKSADELMEEIYGTDDKGKNFSYDTLSANLKNDGSGIIKTFGYDDYRTVKSYSGYADNIQETGNGESSDLEVFKDLTFNREAKTKELGKKGYADAVSKAYDKITGDIQSTNNRNIVYYNLNHNKNADGSVNLSGDFSAPLLLAGGTDEVNEAIKRLQYSQDKNYLLNPKDTDTIAEAVNYISNLPDDVIDNLDPETKDEFKKIFDIADVYSGEVYGKLGEQEIKDLGRYNEPVRDILNENTGKLYISITNMQNNSEKKQAAVQKAQDYSWLGNSNYSNVPVTVNINGETITTTLDATTGLLKDNGNEGIKKLNDDISFVMIQKSCGAAPDTKKMSEIRGYGITQVNDIIDNQQEGDYFSATDNAKNDYINYSLNMVYVKLGSDDKSLLGSDTQGGYVGTGYQYFIPNIPTTEEAEYIAGLVKSNIAKNQDINNIQNQIDKNNGTKKEIQDNTESAYKLWQSGYISEDTYNGIKNSNDQKIGLLDYANSNYGNQAKDKYGIILGGDSAIDNDIVTDETIKQAEDELERLKKEQEKASDDMNMTANVPDPGDEDTSNNQTEAAKRYRDSYTEIEKQKAYIEELKTRKRLQEDGPQAVNVENNVKENPDYKSVIDEVDKKYDNIDVTNIQYTPYNEQYEWSDSEGAATGKSDSEVSANLIISYYKVKQMYSDGAYKDDSSKAAAKGFIDFIEGSKYGKYAYLTPDELGVIKYYTGKGDDKDLSKYLSLLNEKLEIYQVNGDIEKQNKLYDESGFAGKILAAGNVILTDFAKPLAFFESIGGAISGKEADPYSYTMRMFQKADSSHEYLTKGMSPFAKGAADFAIGLVNFVDKLPMGEFALPYMALSAGGDMSYDIIQQGGTYGEAAIGGGASSLVTYAAMKIPVGKLLESSGKAAAEITEGATVQAAKKSLIGRITDVLKKSGINALKQGGIMGGASLAQQYANTLIDIAVTGSKSNYGQYIQSLMSKGLSAEEATRQANTEFFIMQPINALGQGFFTGAITGGAKGLGDGVKAETKRVTEETSRRAEYIDESKLKPGIVESPISKVIKAYTDLITLPKEILPDVNLKALTDSYRVFEANETLENTKAFMSKVHESIRIASENSKRKTPDEGTARIISKLESIREEIKGYIDSREGMGDNINENKEDSSGKIDFDLIKEYIIDVEEKTGIEISKKQIELLKNALRNKEYKKLSPLENSKHRELFKRIKNNLIKEWEDNTGEKWPVYKEDIMSLKTGEPSRKAGSYYDAHHIIKCDYGGDNAWWNIVPAYPDIHQGGIHGANSPATRLFSGGSYDY